MEVAKAVWEFLLDPENREVLGWIAGIVAALIGGLIIFKRIYRTNVSAKNRSLAAGRDVNIGGGTRPPFRRSRKQKR